MTFMKNMKEKIALLTLLTCSLWLILLAPTSSLAVVSGGGCGSEEPQAPKYDLKKHKENTATMGFLLYQYLNENVDQVAIVARAGGDVSKENFRYPSQLKYTHAGIAWKNSKGHWYFKHVLNTCAGPTSDIYDQSLAQFFNDSPYFYDFIVGSPSKELQDKMIQVLEDEKLVQKIHNPDYSNIANPFNRVYQNSNGWVLNALAAAQSGKSTLRGLMNYYKRQGFRPSQVEVGFFKRLR